MGVAYRVVGIRSTLVPVMLHNPRRQLNFNAGIHNMARLSKKVIKEVIKILPEVRDEVITEFERWKTSYKAGPGFYSDEKLLEILPYAAYEYIILAWSIDPSRINKDAAIKALNGKIFKDIRKVTAHALRRIACNQA